MEKKFALLVQNLLKLTRRSLACVCVWVWVKVQKIFLRFLWYEGVRGCTRVYEGVHAYMCVRALCDPKKFFLFFLRKLLTGDRMVCYNESSLKENEVKQNDKNTTYGNAC